MKPIAEYRQKLVTAEKAVRTVRSGDWVEYSHFVMAPQALDEALAKRITELSDLRIRGCTNAVPVKAVVADPLQEHVIYDNWHFSGADRKLHDQGLCHHVPFLYHEAPQLYRRYLSPDVAFVAVAPVDGHGFFNFSTSCSFTKAVIDAAKIVIVEVNDQAPVCLGGNSEAVHISAVDFIVEASNPMIELPVLPVTDNDQKIAQLVLTEIEDRACLQLGIGGMPNAVGKLIAESDLKDLGVHTEILVDAFVDIQEAGRISGNYKSLDPGKITYTFAMGTKKLYDFLHYNPRCCTYDVEYTNSPLNIAANDNVVSINNAIEIDLFGQVCSESSGTRQISGTGGQFDFMFGAFRSQGGKGLICMNSTYTNRKGELFSNIRSMLTPGATVTVHRAVTDYVITEYGKANLKSKSTWERAEALINIAHPQFREELITAAEHIGIWSRTNRLG